MRRATRKPLKAQLNDLLHLHWGERRGFLLMMVLLVLLSVWVALEKWVLPPPEVDMEPFRVELEAWMAERAEVTIGDTSRTDPFPFDPNEIDRPGWLALGLTDRQVDGIERYMAKGGMFRIKRDLARIYSLRPGQYERLEPFILLPEELPRRAGFPRRQQEPKNRPEWPSQYADRTSAPARSPLRQVEVNTADSAALVALPGIGPSFARGILKYRDMLGGFISLDQLSEVYVLKDKPDALERMRDLLVVDSLAVRRIPINSCTVEELAEHPYVRWKLAKPLLAYRSHHGPFARVEDIRGCILIDEEVFRKLAPYLSVE